MHMSVSRRTSVFLIVIGVAIVAALSLLTLPQQAAVQSFTVAQIKSYPFPNELTASATGSRIAWAFNERGARNVWVAEGPDFKPRRLTNYENDDGQELTSLSISADGKYVCTGLYEDLSGKFKLDLLHGYVGFREYWAAMPLSQVRTFGDPVLRSRAYSFVLGAADGP